MSQITATTVLPNDPNTPAVPPQVAEWAKGIPEKFIRPTMEESLKALSESYTHLERSKGSPPSSPTPSNTPNTLSLKAPENKPATFSEKDWDALFDEAAQGTLTDERIAQAEAAGVPKAVIQRLGDTMQTARAGQLNEAAQLVGGQEKLQALVGWAQQSLSPAELNALDKQLKMPGWQNIVLGLNARYEMYNGKPPNSHPMYEPSVVNSNPNNSASPFRSMQEALAAMRDPRYSKDPAYQEDVKARVAATMKQKR